MHTYENNQQVLKCLLEKGIKTESQEKRWFSGFPNFLQHDYELFDFDCVYLNNNHKLGLSLTKRALLKPENDPEFDFIWSKVEVNRDINTHSFFWDCVKSGFIFDEEKDLLTSHTSSVVFVVKDFRKYIQDNILKYESAYSLGVFNLDEYDELWLVFNIDQLVLVKWDDGQYSLRIKPPMTRGDDRDLTLNYVYLRRKDARKNRL